MGGERRGTCRHVRTFSPPFPTHGALSLTHFGRDWQGIGEDRITHKLPPQGDRKGPHPAPHHSRPYNDYEGYHIVTSHCKGGSGVERGGDPCGRPGGSAPLSISSLTRLGSRGPLRSPRGCDVSGREGRPGGMRYPG